jgi:choline dehydrogenase-like flavoprotein
VIAKESGLTGVTSNVSTDNASHYDTESKYYDSVIVGGGSAGCVLAARVHGVRGLHVADSSIMPDIVRGNTHATAVMIGERAADLIG